jgi:predicted dehydrogenase
MKILILGYSDFVQRRVIPILLSTYKHFKIAIASISKKPKAKEKNFFWYNNYRNAIELFKPDIVYISLPNSLHYFWGIEVLKKSINLIIDKPITLKLNHLKKLISLAAKYRVVLAEATIFNYHPQINEAIKIAGGLSKIEVIQSNFCIPQPLNNNIKMSKILGGGVNHDMGPYAAGSFRIFFKKFPEKIQVLSNSNGNIIKDLAVQAKFKNKISYSYFSFGKEYKNDLLIFTKNKIIKINSIYSPNPLLNSLIKIRENNKTREILIKPNSTFKIFFEIFLNSLKRKNFHFFIKDMLFDAKFREIINDKLK